jgi:hypothetical protein
VFLTLFSTSAILIAMSSLCQSGYGMISARVGRGRPGCEEKRFLFSPLPLPIADYPSPTPLILHPLHFFPLIFFFTLAKHPL